MKIVIITIYSLKLCQKYLSLSPMFHQSRHDFHEIAGFMAAIKLEFQNTMPCILAGARGARHAKYEGVFNEATAGARLASGGADFVKGDLMK
jgi:hypothetical protein